jgi:hypothetical protein
MGLGPAALGAPIEWLFCCVESTLERALTYSIGAPRQTSGVQQRDALTERIQNFQLKSANLQPEPFVTLREPNRTFSPDLVSDTRSNDRLGAAREANLPE